MMGIAVNGSWEFGWEAIAALAGVFAVLTASILGWWGILIARQSVDRSHKDHLATRADLTTTTMLELKALSKRFDDELLPFWSWKNSDSEIADSEIPDSKPPQSVLNNMRTVSYKLVIHLKALMFAIGIDPKSELANAIFDRLNTSYACHYIAYLFFVHKKRYTRESLLKLYKNEATSWNKTVQKQIISFIESVPNDEDCCNAALSAWEDTSKALCYSVEELIDESYGIASGKRH